jgi:LemA protein
MKLSKPLLIIIVLAVLILGWVWSTYNNLIVTREGVDGAWAQVETQYQRRFDLIPNLQSTVEGAANFEQDTFLAVTEARTKWLNAQQSGDTDGQIAAASQFDGALSRLLVTVENYPQLQATQAFRDLMAQLEGTENRITVARMDFNNTVQRYNILTKRVPTNIIANIFGFDARSFFDATEGSDVAPTIDFNFGETAS